MVDLIQRAGIVLAHGRPPARALGLPLCLLVCRSSPTSSAWEAARRASYGAAAVTPSAWGRILTTHTLAGPNAPG